MGKNLGPFRFDDATLNDLATRAALVAEDIKNEYGLTEEQVPKVARISLYDIVILCGRFQDDFLILISSSMLNES